ncbi:MAG: tRNA lysidine(34) synthetase TilS [Steroidobacteraceae bacterium]
MFSANELGLSLARLTPPDAGGYLIAVSGGADSLALLAAAARLRDFGRLAGLRALHVDHGLQAAAARFRLACEAACARFAVPLDIVALELAPAAGRSLEELARDGRYAALAAALEPGECLLTAHHEEDQAETFLLQALRGAGLEGLSGMPAVRRLGAGWHLRPLLGVPRAALRAFAATLELAWVEDPMNEDERFDRAWLRHVLWPSLTSRWPAAGAVLARAASHMAEVRARLAALTATELEDSRDGAALRLTALRSLPDDRRTAVVRAFIAERGARPPPEARLAEGLRQMCEAREDANPAMYWDGVALHRYRDRLYLTEGSQPALAPHRWRWRDQPVLELGAGLGTLSLVEGAGGLDTSRLPGELEVRARRGGEVLAPHAGAGHRDLRHLLQERGVPPWRRASIPLLCSGEELIAVADLWTDHRHRVSAQAPGLLVRWQGGPPLE